MEDNQTQQPQPNNPIEPSQSFIQHWLPTIVGIAIVVFVGGGVLAWNYFTGTEPGSPPKGQQQEKWLYFPDFYDIRDISFDKNGDTLWIASIAGLHKYSRRGNLLETYTAVEGLPEIATAVIKINDKLYIGTQGGVVTLDSQTDKFDYLYDRANHKLNSNIDHFEYDGEKLWMTTFGGLRSFDIITSEWKNYGHGDSDFAISDGSVYLIERGNPTPVIWSLDNKSTDQWIQEFQLIDHEWMYIDGNSKYVVATADPKSDIKKNSVLYLKTLPGGTWGEIKLPIPDDGLRYRKLTIGEDDKIYLTYRSSSENMLAVYDLRQKKFNQYALGVFGDVGATRGNVYPDPFQKERIWFSSQILSYLDLDTRIAQYALEPEKPLRFNSILAAREGKVVVNTNVGVGVFNYQTEAFEKISKNHALDAEWVDDTIWLDLSKIGLGIEDVRLGKYNVNDKILEVRSLEHPFLFIKYQEPQSLNRVFLMSRIYGGEKYTSKIVLFDFEQETMETLLEIDLGLPSFNTRPVYSAQYGIVINAIDGVWSFSPASKEYKSLFSTTFVPIFIRVITNEIVVLSDTGTLYRWNGDNSPLVSIWKETQFRKPFSFEVFKNLIAVKSVESLTQYNPGADHGFGPAGFSFYQNKVVLLDFDGSILKILDTSNGMMQVDFSIISSDESCLWFMNKGIWSYCI